MANAVLSGVWTEALKLVLNETWCEQEDDVWTVGLRRGLTGHSALPAAAYHWTKWGRQVTALLNCSAGSGGAGQTALKAQIPYEFDIASFECNGLWLERGKELSRFLALRIRAVAFPNGLNSFPSRIDFRLDNFNSERNRDLSVDQAAIYMSQTRLTNDISSDPLRVIVERDPAAYGTDVMTPALALVSLQGTPDVLRMPLDPPRSGNQKVIAKVEQALNVAFGKPGGGASDVASVKSGFGPDGPDTSTNFSAVAKLLDQMEREQKIADWSAIVPEDIPFIRFGDLTACKVPYSVKARPYKWALICPSRRRTCMVSEIKFEGRILYWLELEHRPSQDPEKEEAFCFLLLSCPPEQVARALEHLFEQAVVNRGVWPKGLPEHLADARIRPMRHRYVQGHLSWPSQAVDRLLSFTYAKSSD